jgi:hypothetical protein
VENYFNYFTEIEEHFQKRRGAGLLLSTLDWALIETWKDAAVPLEAVLRGIDAAFEKYQQRKSSTQKVNSLAYCSQAVLAAAEEMKEAAVGAQRDGKPGQTMGFEPAGIAAFFRRNADLLQKANLPAEGVISAKPVAEERRMTVIEEKLFAVLLAATADAEIVSVRAQADRDLAPYRSKMPSAQIDQMHKQYVNKRLVEKYGLPRLSLFYM